MTFDDFSDRVESHLKSTLGMTEIQIADYLSPRTRQLIQAYQEGRSVSDTAAILASARPAQQFLD